jgi:hypothetical protein
MNDVWATDADGTPRLMSPVARPVTLEVLQTAGDWATALDSSSSTNRRAESLVINIYDNLNFQTT